MIAEGFKRMLFQALARKGLRSGEGTAVIGDHPHRSPAGYHEVQGETTHPAQYNQRQAKTVKMSHRARSGKVQNRKIKNRQRAPHGHSHAVLRHALVPHPKYGDKFPHFRSWLDSEECNCDGARLTSSIKRRLARDARMRLQPAVVDAKPSSAASGTSGTLERRCAAKTKLGAQCKRAVREGSERFCSWHESAPAERPLKLGRGA